MKTIIALSLLFSSQIYAVEAIITDLRGNATVLKPKKHEAELVTVGQKIPEDSSILTQDKSMVKLIYPDKTTVVVGPNSKIVVELIQQKNKPGLISLLKGVIRAKVTKEKYDPANKEKFLVKTRMASVGIRGTEFQFGLSDDQKTTSLLTYEGMVELSNESLTKEEVLASKKSLVKGAVVSAGEFSNTNDKIILAPLKIDENQFNALAKNETLINESKGDSVVIDVENSSQTFIDFNSGKVLKEKDLRMDSETGKMIEVSNNSTVVSPNNRNVSISLSNIYNYYKYSSNSNEYYYKQHTQKLSFSSHIKDENSDYYLIAEVYNLTKPTFKKSRGLTTMGNSLENDLMMGLAISSTINRVGSFQHQYTIGVSPKTYFKENGMNSVENENESAPEISANLGLNFTETVQGFVKVHAFLVDFDKLGLKSELGLRKDISRHFNIKGSIGAERIGSKQKSGLAALEIGSEF